MACTPAAASDTTPIDYIEGPLIYAQALLCKRTATPPDCERAEQLKATALRRFGYLLDFSPQYDAIYLQWMLALYSLDHDPALYALAADNARDAQTRARNGEGLYLLSWNGETLPPQDALPGMLQTQAATTSLFAWLAVYPPPGPSRMRQSHRVVSARLACRRWFPRGHALQRRAHAALSCSLTRLPAGCGSSVGALRECDATDGERASSTCPAAVLDALSPCRDRVYHEGVASERTAAAVHSSRDRAPCAKPCERRRLRGRARGRPGAGRDRAHDEPYGAPATASPRRRGSPTRWRRCAGRSSAPRAPPIGSFVTSVWADDGFIAEIAGRRRGRRRAARTGHRQHRAARSRCRQGTAASRHAHRARASPTVHLVPGRRSIRPARCASTC